MSRRDAMTKTRGLLWRQQRNQAVLRSRRPCFPRWTETTPCESGLSDYFRTHLASMYVRTSISRMYIHICMYMCARALFYLCIHIRVRKRNSVIPFLPPISPPSLSLSLSIIDVLDLASSPTLKRFSVLSIGDIDRYVFTYVFILCTYAIDHQARKQESSSTCKYLQYFVFLIILYSIS